MFAARIKIFESVPLKNGIRRCLLSASSTYRRAQSINSVVKNASWSTSNPGSNTSSHEQLPPLTASRYHITRDKRFNQISDADMQYFERFVGPENVLTSPDACNKYNVDWLRMYRGQSRVVLRPRETQQVSEIMRWCNQTKLAVVPQGGNTSLVGGSIPVFDEIIISMNLMNRVLNYDPVSGVILTQAGVILQDLETYANKHDRLVPIDLGAKGSCHIGGNAMTCAGGVRLFRYGSLHANILGLEMVLADGSVLPIGTAQLKNNTGYHTHHLFLGSEGTLGICTALAIRCPVLPACRQVMFLSLPSFTSLMETFRLAESTLNEVLSAFEYFDQTAMTSVAKNLHMKNPLPNDDNNGFYAVVEVSGFDAENIQQRIEKFLESATSKNLIRDGTVAASYQQQRDLWQFRERIIEALQCDGYTYKFDVSVPKQKMHDIVEQLRRKFPDDIVACCGYGHLGDNNLHLGVTANEFSEKFYKTLTHTVFDWVRSEAGSISAEHGIGTKLLPYLNAQVESDDGQRSYAEICRSLKNLFDPNNILNPYKMIPQGDAAKETPAYDSV